MFEIAFLLTTTHLLKLMLYYVSIKNIYTYLFFTKNLELSRNANKTHQVSMPASNLLI